jgi:hypothetical protein
MTADAAAVDPCVVGVDYGTLFGRAVVVRVSDGAELGAAVHDYRHGVMDAELAATGEPLPPGWALQDPEDYLDVLREAVPAALTQAGIDTERVIGIGTDFTASTPLPVTRDGTPLCRFPGLDLDTQELPALEMPYGQFQPASGVRACLNGWLAAGGPHHEVMNLGHHAAAWHDFCNLAGIEFVQV